MEKGKQNKPGTFIRKMHQSLKGRYTESIIQHNLPLKLLLQPEPPETPVNLDQSQETWMKKNQERFPSTKSKGASLLALNGGGRFLSPSSPLSSLLCSLVSWETLSALLSKLKYYGLTGLLMQLTLSKLGFRGTWLPWRNVRSRLYDGAWERWRIVCLPALSVEDIEDIYLFGTMITGILLIGLGFTLGYRRIQKTGTAVQSPTRLPVWLKLWEERSALRLNYNRNMDSTKEKFTALQREID